MQETLHICEEKRKKEQKWLAIMIILWLSLKIIW